MNQLWDNIVEFVDAERLKATLLYDSANPLLFNTGLFLRHFCLYTGY